MALEPDGGRPGRPHDRMRTSAADRERTVDMLKASFAEGRLTLQECEDRIGQALSSRTYAELAALTRDLPVAPVAPPGLRPAQPPQVLTDRPFNRLAVAALVCALIPGMPGPLGLALGITARSQIRRTGDRGAALANMAIAIGGFLTLLLLLFVARLL